MGTGVRLPAGVLIAFALMVLAAGVFWWARTAPAAPPAAGAPLQQVVTVRLDDGRVLTYQRGRSFGTDPGHRRPCGRPSALFPDLRLAGPGITPPIFLVRCG